MDGSGNNLLADTTFSLNQNSNICIGNLIDHLFDSMHLLAGIDEYPIFRSHLPHFNKGRRMGL